MKNTDLNRLYKIIAEQQSYILELNDALVAARAALNRLSVNNKTGRFKGKGGC